MKHHDLIILLLTAITFTSCKQERVWVKYLETACADPWWPNNNTESAVKSHFSELGVNVCKVTVTSENAPDPCMACSCLSGNVIRCEVQEKDVSAMQEHGFTAD